MILIDNNSAIFLQCNQITSSTSKVVTQILLINSYYEMYVGI